MRAGDPSGDRMTHEYERALGARLRYTRMQRGLSRHDVQAQSEGRWSAAAVGSYERAERAVTVTRLAELAEFYGVPVGQLLPDHAVPRARPGPRLMLDLHRLAELPSQQAGPLARYAAAIQYQRGDRNDELLNIRTEDLRSLAVIYDLTPETLAEQLTDCGVLRTGAATNR
jgi:transcriptional regulator with XRE-family HTH domain